MDLNKIIKDSIKDNRVILGYERSIKELKTKKTKLVVHANNLPKDKLDNIIHNARIAGVEVKEYPDNNANLGLFCGKPFPVSVLVIKVSEK